MKYLLSSDEATRKITLFGLQTRCVSISEEEKSNSLKKTADGSSKCHTA